MSDRKCVLVRIEGRVQGVWYRGWTMTEAQKRGLDGWVRNRSDGSVEALFSGLTDRVNDMLAACERGPTAARVDGVFPKPADSPVETGFSQRPTI
ncbi:acylphosphatase [Magnetospira sp. QH-2]|uniref:acylphosphatase n=1 Tax=Magnetospira sp. (strain QH-2) TaxID=1288970 RepID=UPI0003E80D26|nr:acylphosphatase [Magnetospira sp. QH-2]CCQ74568.1 Acylphosphatase [Magnetospira sp. QH-2]